jgi:membrane associated rhomboid family serine protease
MTLLSRLERHLGWLSIERLPLYIVTAQAIIYVWSMINGNQAMLILDPVAVSEGHEYWRLLTFLFVIPTQNPIFAFFFLYLLYIYGMALENEWGSFPFTCFYLLGALGTCVAAFWFGSTEGAFYLNTTLFLAFAAVHPNFELLLFFFIPVKIKWLAAFTWVWFVIRFFMSNLEVRAAILISLINYFLFFSKSHFDTVMEWVRTYQHKRRFKDWPT